MLRKKQECVHYEIPHSFRKRAKASVFEGEVNAFFRLEFPRIYITIAQILYHNSHMVCLVWVFCLSCFLQEYLFHVMVFNKTDN